MAEEVTIMEMFRRFDSIDLTELYANAMENYPDEIAQLNRDQLWEGIDSKGNSITPPYTAMTKWLKEQKGQPWDRVTLRDTGQFQSKLHLVIQGDMYDLKSDDSKEASLKAKYGDDIEGLTDANKEETENIVHNDVVHQIAQKTGAEYG